MNIKGMKALVTGASGGLGQAIAKRLHQEGAELILTGRRADLLASLAKETGARTIVADLANRDDVARCVDDSGPVDIFVANAGLPATGSPLEFTEAELERALDVNLRAPMLMARRIAEGMIERKRGSIVFVSSISGKVAAQGSAVYSATKFGLRGFALGLREDLSEHGIGVVTIFPGFIRNAGMFAESQVKLPRGRRQSGRDHRRIARSIVRRVPRRLQPLAGDADLACRRRRQDRQAAHRIAASQAMMRHLTVVAVALLCCSGLAAGKPKKKSAPAEKAKPTAKAPKDALVAAADEIARQVSALRGLTQKTPLQRGVLSRDEIGKKLKERIAKEYTPEEVRLEARVLRRLGLLPPDVDYEKLLLDLLMEQVAGFYDPFAGKLYIADWLPLEMQRPALAHEIEHALQDQHFDLKKFATPIKDDGDRQLARASLVEGDATAVMLEFQAQAMGLPADQLGELVAQMGKQLISGSFGNTPQFDKAPRFVKETLMFPYLSGLLFVEYFRRNSPWTKIDEVFRVPPESTEQVIHPEKYVGKEHPVKIIPGALASLGSKKEVRRDVFGELVFKILFSSAASPPAGGKSDSSQEVDITAAEKAAAGWGGDREVAYGEGDGPVTVVDFSTWDTEGDAKEAEAAAKRLMQKLAEADEKRDDWVAARQDDKLVLVFGAEKGKGQAIIAEAWKTWKVSR
jgi:short-subunit dehydrogenase